jgi:phosphatidylserine/phosphatidylglycerophosphate/cardiolipin synthase-like enzyme
MADVHGAKRTMLVYVDAFTSAPMAKARLDAHNHGVQVQVVLHKNQCTELYSSADFLANQGVPIMIDADHAITHHKVMMIDGEIIVTGRVNGTKAAQATNAEPGLILRGSALAVQDMPNWDLHRRPRQPYVGRGVRD